MSRPAAPAVEVDTARLPLLLGELRLPAIGRPSGGSATGCFADGSPRGDGPRWPSAPTARAGPPRGSCQRSPSWRSPNAHAGAPNAIAKRSDCEAAGGAAIREWADARLPPDKTLDGFGFAHVPMLSRARAAALASGDAWPEKGKNLLLLGPPGSGKTHISAALSRALVENGCRVLFARTTELVQRLQAARQDLALEAALAKLDRYDLLVLDDLSYVRKDQAETSVLFKLISKRYERRSMLITANQPFGEWNKVSPIPP